MKTINTLIPDVYELLSSKGGWFSPELCKEFSHEIETRLTGQFNKDAKAPTLRLSQMGPRCPKALWASIHAPDEAEDLPPWARFKFAYGDIIEALAISLAKAAGHKVEGEQDAVYVDGITGHRDCVIDGCLVDVKSASSRSFQKFKDGSLRMDDSFGYLDQLDGYLVGSHDDPIVQVKDKGYLWAIDKTLGHMVLYEHSLREDRIKSRIADYKAIVARTDIPSCTCATVPDGKSGNIRLDTVASYNAYKYYCRPNLRTFLYADGPRYLTTVVRKPDVPEIDRYGNIIYA